MALEQAIDVGRTPATTQRQVGPGKRLEDSGTAAGGVVGPAAFVAAPERWYR